LEKESCQGDREITNEDGECEACLPYTRAQKENSVCLSDQCNDNQIITWLGTCADCEDGTKPDANKGSCVGPAPVRLNALVDLEEEPKEETATATKKRSFPTGIVVVLALLIVILSAATAFIYYRSQKVAGPKTAQEIQEGEKRDERSVEHLSAHQSKKKADVEQE